MSKISYLLALALLSCKLDKSDFTSPITIINSSVTINYYEDDSLNKARSYVLPVIYFDFVAINSSDSLFNLIVNTREDEEQAMLFVVFTRQEEIDTLILTDFESFKINKITPNDTTRFTVAGFIPDHIPDINDEYYSAKELMKSIAETGKVYYANSQLDGIIIKEGILYNYTGRINRSNDFEIIYRESNDTSVE